MKSEIELQSLARKLRKKFSLDVDSPIDVTNVILQIPKITLVKLPIGNNISGMCFKSLNLIVINSNKSMGRQNFSMGHELYHLFYDNSQDNVICSILENNKNDIDIEREADLFASYFLAPYDSFFDFVDEKIKKGELIERIIVDTEQRYGLSRAATLYRLKKEHFINGNDYDKYKENVISIAAKYGYSNKLYKKTNEQTTNGYYIEMVNKLYKEQIISTGKREELLLEAYREDLLYVESLDEGYIYD